MNRAEQKRKADAFRRLHDRSAVLLLPNAWDALSARVFEASGFAAIATTSAGVAWSLGYADGERAPRAEIVAATARIARAVNVPVTADIEAGFGVTPDEVQQTVAAIIDAGAVGVNIEDGTHVAESGLRSIDVQVARLTAARAAANAAGVPIVINARTDLYLHDGADTEKQYDETVRRSRAYLAAGADCVYPIGLADHDTIAALVKALDAPINLTARLGLADMDELHRLGVARVSLATAPVRLAMACARDAAVAVRATGRFDTLATPLSHGEIQSLWTKA
jgi:2-methylisocitrate lyase-like PEP mutase family enzyme